MPVHVAGDTTPGGTPIFRLRTFCQDSAGRAVRADTGAGDAAPWSQAPNEEVHSVRCTREVLQSIGRGAHRGGPPVTLVAQSGPSCPPAAGRRLSRAGGRARTSQEGTHVITIVGEASTHGCAFCGGALSFTEPQQLALVVPNGGRETRFWAHSACFRALVQPHLRPLVDRIPPARPQDMHPTRQVMDTPCCASPGRGSWAARRPSSGARPNRTGGAQRRTLRLPVATPMWAPASWAPPETGPSAFVPRARRISSPQGPS